MKKLLQAVWLVLAGAALGAAAFTAFAWLASLLAWQFPTEEFRAGMAGAGGLIGAFGGFAIFVYLADTNQLD